jgi:beta-glucosidase
MDLSKQQFGEDFKWGVSTAAYQVEGAWDTDGKGRSIWDIFANTKGKIRQGQHGNVACDFYHRYAHDISLMSHMNIPNYRFSISWSRIIPNGYGCVNMAGY